MKYVDSGNGKMPLISLLAILSISLCINMPGLAVSPMLGKIRHVFGCSELEAQLLTSLPNLVMIPVVLIAGRISTPKWQTAVMVWGLSIFLAAGVGCLFCSSLTGLIILGCLVGIGCALVVPIAAGMISEWFIRKPRQRDLGLKSTASNTMVIIANVFVGMIVTVNWHFGFAPYLVALIPLALVPFMTNKYIKAHRIVNNAEEGGKDDEAQPYHFQGHQSLMLLISLIVLYVLLTYSTTSISYFAPFMMDKYGMNTTQVGLVTAAYYCTVAIAGAVVAIIKRYTGYTTMYVCLGVIAAGLIIIGFTHNFGVMFAASLAVGFAYGVIQPIIYNKTTYIAPDQQLGMKYFGYVLSSNYLSIMMVPFVDNFFRRLFHSDSPGFEFVFSGCVVAGLLTWAFISRKSYVFEVNAKSAAPVIAAATPQEAVTSAAATQPAATPAAAPVGTPEAAPAAAPDVNAPKPDITATPKANDTSAS